MEKPVLSDKNQCPSEEVIFFHIGKAKPLWLALFEFIRTEHSDFTQEWKYYNDGKSWLLKVSRKKKTIFWLSVRQDSFRTTFYFTDRAEEKIMASNISEELKLQFKNGKQYNRIRGITVSYTTKKKDIEAAKALIGIKILMK
jgi:hypothetical protein